MSELLQPKIKLYTNHGCGWSQRVHITLKELGLPCEEVLLDLDQPRPDWYLKLNPRGQVPVLQYTPPGSIEDDTNTPDSAVVPTTYTLVESNAIVQFLTSRHPSHLTPGPILNNTLPSNSTTTISAAAAYKIYLQTLLIDQYFSKINPLMFKLVGSSTATAEAEIIASIIDNLHKEIEPLIEQWTGEASSEAPFFTNARQITIAEVMIAPFALRLLDFANGVIFPVVLKERIQSEAPRFYRWVERARRVKSISETWDPVYYVPRIEERLPAAKRKYANA